MQLLSIIQQIKVTVFRSLIRSIQKVRLIFSDIDIDRKVENIPYAILQHHHTKMFTKRCLRSLLISGFSVLFQCCCSVIQCFSVSFQDFRDRERARPKQRTQTCSARSLLNWLISVLARPIVRVCTAFNMLLLESARKYIRCCRRNGTVTHPAKHRTKIPPRRIGSVTSVASSHVSSEFFR